MGIFSYKIKEILDKIFGKKQKMLYSGNRETNYNANKRTNFKNEQKGKAESGVKNAYLEKALSQYFEEYLKQLDEANITGKMPSSYSALIGINAIKGNSHLDKQSEIDLLSRINAEGKYYTQEQKKKNTNKCSFYHIQRYGYQTPKNMVRIYLNCKDENVIQLVNELLNNSENQNFYLKFDSVESMQDTYRSEKIVIYTDDEHLNQDIDTIRYVKRTRSELFESSEKMNPFIQSFDGTYSIARQVSKDKYMNLNGELIELQNSNNSYIAKILQDSYMEAVRDIAKKDSNISFLLDNRNNNYDLYMKNYKYINENHHSDLINFMENNMKILANNNDVIIKGISPNTLKEEEQSRESI